MVAIDIEFDVFKTLTNARESEADTYSDVIRRAFQIPSTAEVAPASPGANFKGVHLPEGTDLRATYKGKQHTAKIQNGRWVSEQGEVRNSPSQAAWYITESGVNGWMFWEVKRPSDANWRLLDSLRR
jgi:hypothetical protein